MGLREYKKKRDFETTPEPAGEVAPKAGRSYCIQKHVASHLHYDFRLELDGVLKSWAVPKGPSLDPAVKRLAMHVEDHPVEYGSFEGTIPEGEYGGGTVMLWDRGEWEAVGDAAEGYRSGRLKFQLRGEKLQGAWMLLRTGGVGKDERRWLLFKERDEFAKPSAEGDVLEEMPKSVSSGRDLDEIAAGKKAKARKAPISPVKNRTVKRKPLAQIEVELATLTKEAPEGDDWLHEIKYDGYRMVCRMAGGHAEFISRNNQDWTARLQPLANAAAKLDVKDGLLDGEVVAVRPDGVTHFQDLQNAFSEGRTAGLRYYVFDLLSLNGRDLTSLPLLERKALLAKLLKRKAASSISYSEHIVGNGPAFFQEAAARGLEGIISKRADSPYRGGRGADWLKVKCVNNEEFVIGGYTQPAGTRTGFGAILVGARNDRGELAYAGKVGTGFDDKTLRTLSKRFAKLEANRSPFADRKRAAETTHWMKPELVAQIAFGSRTNEGILRHASFLGLREDKAAEEVTREKPVAMPALRSERKRKTTAAGDYDAANQLFAGVRLTSPDKVYYPDAGITKLDLAHYYRDAAEWILPHIAGRPLVLVRSPDGSLSSAFYQKHPGPGTPNTLKRISIQQKSSSEST